MKHVSNIKVLMYHRVVEEPLSDDTNWHFVQIDDFKKQLKLIDSMGFTPITFLDYKLFKEGKLTLPKKPIIITFDDGYLDTYELAIPALIELNMRAVIFVMGNRDIKRAYWDEKNKTDHCLLMTDEQVKNARKLGFEIGAHSLNHLELPELTTEEVRAEIMNSKQNLEALIGESICTFAYPYGSVDRRIRQFLADSRFEFACGVYSGPPKFGEDLFDFRRLAVNQNTNSFLFALKLLTPFQYAEWIYFRIKANRKDKKDGMHKEIVAELN